MNGVANAMNSDDDEEVMDLTTQGFLTRSAFVAFAFAILRAS